MSRRLSAIVAVAGLGAASVALTGCYRTTPPIWLTDLPAATQSASRVTDSPRSLMGVDGKPFEVEGTLRSVEIEEQGAPARVTFDAPVKAEPIGASMKIDSPSGSRLFAVNRTTVARLGYSGSTDRSTLRNGGTALIVVGIAATLVGGVLILAGAGEQLHSGSETMLHTGQAMAPGGAVLGAIGATLFILARPKPAPQ